MSNADKKTRLEPGTELTDFEMDSLSRTLAYEWAIGVIFDGCVSVPKDETCAEAEVGTWWKFDPAHYLEHGGDDFLKAIAYINARGLIERHATQPNWFAVRDESEATR